MCIHVYASICKCAYTHVYLCVCPCVFICVYGCEVNVYMVYVCICMYVVRSVCVYMVYVHPCLYTCIVRICMCIWEYVQCIQLCVYVCVYKHGYVGGVCCGGGVCVLEVQLES